eukprot:1160383-Pelagomonas_calceolata.AAC.11
MANLDKFLDKHPKLDHPGSEVAQARQSIADLPPVQRVKIVCLGYRNRPGPGWAQQCFASLGSQGLKVKAEGRSPIHVLAYTTFTASLSPFSCWCMRSYPGPNNAAPPWDNHSLKVKIEDGNHTQGAVKLEGGLEDGVKLEGQGWHEATHTTG